MATRTVVASWQANSHPFPPTIEGERFALSVLAMNADGLLTFSQAPEFVNHRNRTRVGVWYWEVGQLPDSMRPAYNLVDEVWCASDHVLASLASPTDRPVRKHPLIIDPPAAPTALRRTDLGLPENRFLFGLAFDYASVARRKNARGLIEAYRSAFGPDDGAGLVLKTINANARSAEAAAVRDAAGSRPDIIFIDDRFDHPSMTALFELLDCYTSLHRSEGLGLSLAAAMAAGTPAIATGWSGNLEFMNDANSILVPYELVEVGPDAEPYAPDSWWAQPDLARAPMRCASSSRTPIAPPSSGVVGKAPSSRRTVPREQPIGSRDDSPR